MEIDEFRSFFFDLDKTLWNWDRTIIGAEDAIDTLREAGKNVCFHTDNTLLTRTEYAKKLTSMGIPADKEEIITSAYAVAKHLEAQNVTEAYVIGESGLVKELDRRDINVSEDADIMVAGFDRQFNYSKLRRAMKILENGRLYICSRETTFRNSSGEQPHQGPTNLALNEFSEAINAGKPGEIFRDCLKDEISFFPGRSLFIGDRLDDIETGNRLGMETAAVMSGDIDSDIMHKADEIQTPDYGISSLTKLKRRII